MSPRHPRSRLLPCLLLALATSAHAGTISKTETIEYHDNLPKWVLGQVKRTTVATTPTNAIETTTTTFDPVTALPLQTTNFGKVTQTLTYDTTSTVPSGQLGTLKTVADGNGNVITLTNWKRGIPQTIQFPATQDQPSGATKSAVVDTDGWIRSVTDENGYKTCYRYDLMGRLSLIQYPSETVLGACDELEAKWNSTIRAFGPAQVAAYGLPIGHWQEIVSTGNGFQKTYFNALWRPVVTERYDSGDPATTRSVSVTRYDVDGHAVFQSYPLASQPNFNDVTLLGTRTTYDPLDRVTRIEQDSELGVLTTTKVYNGNEISTTNPLLHETVVGHRMYDQPTYDMPYGITHPEGATTVIYRNSLDKPYALQRRNADSSLSVWRHYAYDQYQQLCRMAEPETGATVMGYDGAGNLAWSASGLATNTPCDGTNSAVVARKASRTYDARNRVKTLSFPDGVGNQVWTYTPDGLASQITTYNAANNGVPVINAYHYNERRMLDGQGESISQPAWYTWGLGYGYDANGSLSTHVYPGNITVDYAPNALGQPTKVGMYATNVSYYPNGAVKAFTYGNNIPHLMLQNARQLPAWVTGAPAVHFSYGYDANSNITSVTDYISTGRQTRSMTYDGLDRLKTATSAMFGTASYDYDVLDNLTRVNTGGTAARDHYYCYDANWRLTNVKTTSCSGASVIGLGYDVQGNLDNKNGQNYDFDFGNRLRLVTGQESYRYDGHGRRVLAWSVQGLGNILSQYDMGGALRFQSDARKGKTFAYFYLGGSLVATSEAPSGTSNYVVKYQHTDPLGTPVAVSDASGVVIERSEYEPYGKVLNRPIHDGPGYTGHVEDAATGLTYMQQRYYDPGIGRFLSVDPVTADTSTGGNFNRYKYAANNPYRFTDPDGRQERAAGGFGESYPTLTPAEKAPLEAVAIQATATALAVTPVIGPILTLSFRTAVAAQPKPADKTIYRMGDRKESPTRLGNKAAEAEGKIGTHGVSGSTTKPSGPCSSASCSSLESAGFPVRATPTKNDPGHVTIELPKPVTKEVADKLNKTLGR